MVKTERIIHQVDSPIFFLRFQCDTELWNKNFALLVQRIERGTKLTNKFPLVIHNVTISSLLPSTPLVHDHHIPYQHVGNWPPAAPG